MKRFRHSVSTFLLGAALALALAPPAGAETRSARISGGETVDVEFDGGLPATVRVKGIRVLDASLFVTLDRDDEAELRWRFTLKPARRFDVTGIWDVNGERAIELPLETVPEGRVLHLISTPYTDAERLLSDARELYVFRIEGSSPKHGHVSIHQAILVDERTKRALRRDLREGRFSSDRP